jgi:hypothetical protein
MPDHPGHRELLLLLANVTVASAAKSATTHATEPSYEPTSATAAAMHTSTAD